VWATAVHVSRDCCLAEALTLPIPPTLGESDRVYMVEQIAAYFG
jgi:hypothetical protein